VTRQRALPLLVAIVLALPASVAAGALTGRLVLDGKAAVGATVSAIPFEEPLAKARREARGAAEAAPLATAAVGKDGTFSLAVPATAGKETPFLVRFGARGAVPADQLGVYDPSESEDLGEISLRKAEALAGRVTGPDGRPLAGARVALSALGRFNGEGGQLPPVLQKTVSGPDGTFRFESAATERNELVVTAAGFAPVRVPAAKAGALRGAIALVAGTSLSGSVKGRDGRPVSGAFVRYEADGLETRWVETGADGAFRLADVPSRRGNVVADAGEGGFAERPVSPEAGRAPLALVLAPPTVLEGRTLDVASLKPVARVRLMVSTGEAVRLASSGTDGRYVLRGLRPGEVTVRADESRHVGWARSGVSLARGETTRLDVLLTRGAALSGRVVDEDGRPVAGAKLSVSPGEQDPFSFVMRRLAGDPGARIASRADGTFSATRLAPGENQRLTVYHPDYEKGVLGGIALSPGGTRTGAVVTLRRGIVVTGTVKDDEGKPVAGAEVGVSASRVVRSSRGGMRMSVSFGGISEITPARSGADGRFEVRGVPPGDWALTAKSPGRATEVVDPLRLSRDARPDPVEIVLAPGASLSGIVRRRTGEGAEGYLVIAREGGKPPTGIGPDTMPTGPDGAFFLDGLKRDTAYDLQLFGGAGFGPGPTKKGVIAPASDLEWVVEGLGRIEGIALDGKTGEPLTSFEVSCEVDRAGFGQMRMGRGMRRRGAGGVGEPVVVEAPDGRFAIEEVPAGKWQVVVTAKGYQPGRAAGVVVEEATTTDGVDVRVPRGSRLEVLVLDARTRKGVPDARVAVLSETGAPAFGGLGIGDGDLRTDVDGRAFAEGLAPGKVTVTVDHDDYTPGNQSAVLAEEGGRVEVALSHGGSLGGVVLSETRQPLSGAEVSLEGGSARGNPFGAGNGTATDGSGRFRFDHLAPGRYTLRASVSGQASEPVEAVLVGTETKDDVTLVLAGGATLRGGVAGLRDEQRAGVSVNASGPKDYWASARTGPDGRFELTGAPVGTISLRATAGDFLSGSTRSATATVTIAEGQREADVELVFEGSGTLSGRITRGGQPVPDVRVTAREKRGGLGASGRTDESGAYRVEGIVAGDYTVSAQASFGPGGRGVTKEIRIDGEATLDFELPTASLYGVVVDSATKQPLADARVLAKPEGSASGRAGSATTDTSGRFFVEDLEPGAHALTLRRTGYEEAGESAEATEAGGDAGTIEMTRGEGLALRVRDGIYQIPLRSVSVRVTDGAGATVTATWLGLDGEGSGEIASLRPGRYSLVLGSDGYATRVIDGVVVPGATLEVVLTPGGSVEVRAGEASRAKGTATLHDAAGRPYPYRTWGSAGELTLSPAGTQLLPNIAPGSYTLAVEGAAPKVFTVAEGGRTVVELP
jgi:protocatechuate 3,4-dioxygenase beta subunit